MNILMFSWRGHGHPLSGGAEQTTIAHASAWAKAGHKVTLFTSNFFGARRVEYIKGVRIIRQGDQFFMVKIYAMLWYLFKNKENFDLVVDEFHGIPFFTPLYVRTKKLGFIHEISQKVWSLNYWPKPFNLIPAVIGRIGEPWVFRLLYKSIPFMTVSKSTKKDLEKFGIKNVTVINNGVTLPEKLPKNLKEKTFSIIYLGSLAKDKGIEDGIIAFKKFYETNKDCQMWIVGNCDSNYLLNLKQIAKDFPITFLGYVSESEKFNLLSRAHVLLNPSIHEGWGLVNIEANSCGIPVVGYDVSGIRDSVVNGKTGLLVEEKNINQLADAIYKIKMGLINGGECKKWASKFTWSKSTSNSLKFIKSL